MVGRFLFLSPEPPRMELSFSSERGKIIRGRLFLPATASHTQPAGCAIIVHGVASARDLVEPMAKALTEKGIAVFTYDTPYTADAENEAILQTAIKYLYHLNFIDSQKIALIGHSMGARVAVNVASRVNVKAVVSMGMSVFASPEAPPNLLMIIGFYDQIHPPLEMIEALKINTGGFSEEGKLWGDFSRGNARMLFISPAADHVSEVFDPAIIAVAGEWISRSFELTTEDLNSDKFKPPPVADRIQFIFLIYLGAWGILLSLFFLLKEFFFSRKIFSRIMPAILAALFICLVFIFQIENKFISCDALAGRILFLLCSGFMVFNYLIQSLPPDSMKESLDSIFKKKILRAFLYILIIYFAFQVVIIFSAIPYYAILPSSLKAIPLFLWKQITLGGYHRLIVAGRLFSPASIEGLFLPLLLGLEIISPGSIMKILLGVAGSLLGIRREKRKTSIVHIAILIIVIIAAVWAWFPWVKSGQVDLPLLYSLLKLCIKFFVLPIILIYLIISTKLFRKLDSLLTV